MRLPLHPRRACHAQWRPTELATALPNCRGLLLPPRKKTNQTPRRSLSGPRVPTPVVETLPDQGQHSSGWGLVVPSPSITSTCHWSLLPETHQTCWCLPPPTWSLAPPSSLRTPPPCTPPPLTRGWLPWQPPLNARPTPGAAPRSRMPRA